MKTVRAILWVGPMGLRHDSELLSKTPQRLQSAVSRVNRGSELAMTEYTAKSWDEVPVDPCASYHLLESFKDYTDDEIDSSLRQVQKWIKTGFKQVPELAGETIYVGITHDEITHHGEPHAMADPYNRIIYLNRGCIAEGYQTLCHELMHVLIRKEVENGNDRPITSEEYCSIRTIATMDADLLYRDDIAYLGEPNAAKDDWPHICQRALDYREDNRNYIQKCTEWLKI